MIACGRNFTEEEMRGMGTLTRCCTNNIYVRVLCKECQKKYDTNATNSAQNPVENLEKVAQNEISADSEDTEDKND